MKKLNRISAIGLLLILLLVLLAFASCNKEDLPEPVQTAQTNQPNQVTLLYDLDKTKMLGYDATLQDTVLVIYSNCNSTEYQISNGDTIFVQTGTWGPIQYTKIYSDLSVESLGCDQIIYPDTLLELNSNYYIASTGDTIQILVDNSTTFETLWDSGNYKYIFTYSKN